VRVISNKALLAFAKKHAKAGKSLQAWRKLVASSDFANFARLKAVINTTDRVGEFYVFDIGGNKFRIVAAIHFNRQMLFVRHVFTHDEYARWSANR
jgi:mRNA interferase HigB